MSLVFGSSYNDDDFAYPDRVFIECKSNDKFDASIICYGIQDGKQKAKNHIKQLVAELNITRPRDIYVIIRSDEGCLEYKVK